MICECHNESGPHELCCGREDGRSPDCPEHGDGSGPNAVRQPIRTLTELLDEAAAKDDQGEAFGKVILGMFSALEKQEGDR